MEKIPLVERNPSFDCLVRGHISAAMINVCGEVYGWWCIWCGTAAYDPDKHLTEG